VACRCNRCCVCCRACRARAAFVITLAAPAAALAAAWRCACLCDRRRTCLPAAGTPFVGQKLPFIRLPSRRPASRAIVAPPSTLNQRR